MILGRVVGNVVATQKNYHLSGKKLMIVQPVDCQCKNAGSETLAVDGVGCGVGELVLAICEGGSARIVTKAENLAPIDIAIAGIVDSISCS
jgi:microcompartment protein CcmK/EutM